MNEELTGNIGYRTTLIYRKLIAQVEYKVQGDPPGSYFYRWKDATINEIAQAEKIRLNQGANK